MRGPQKSKTMGDEGNVDAKKLTGVLVAAVLTVTIAATAEQDTLALIDIGLVGLLYILRRRRLTLKTSRAL